MVVTTDKINSNCISKSNSNSNLNSNSSPTRCFVIPKKLTQIQTMHLIGLSVLSYIADIFEKKSENCGLQFEDIFQNLSRQVFSICKHAISSRCRRLLQITGLSSREIIKPPQFNETMLSFNVYINFKNFQNLPLWLAHVHSN